MMTRGRNAIKVLIAMLLVMTPAFAGGFVAYNHTFDHFIKLDDEYLKSKFYDMRIVSGTGPGSETNERFDANVITGLTNFRANLSDNNAYLAYTKGKYFIQAGQEGKIPINKSVTVNSYIIMTGKFDSIQNVDMHFSEENLTQANMIINLTYNGKTYQFEAPETKIDNESIFNLFLQPFCNEFEEIGLDATRSDYKETASSDGLDYSGSLTIEAFRNEV